MVSWHHLRPCARSHAFSLPEGSVITPVKSACEVAGLGAAGDFLRELLYSRAIGANNESRRTEGASMDGAAMSTQDVLQHQMHGASIRLLCTSPIGRHCARAGGDERKCLPTGRQVKVTVVRRRGGGGACGRRTVLGDDGRATCAILVFCSDRA